MPEQAQGAAISSAARWPNPHSGAGTVVMKFGGTSVANKERITRAAQRIVRAKEEGNRVVAVLSAQGKFTDELVVDGPRGLPRPHPREMDMLLSTGERISCALAAMVINDLGHEAELADRLPGRDRHRHLAHEGARSSTCAPSASRRRSTPADRARRGLPGRVLERRAIHAT